MRLFLRCLIAASVFLLCLPARPQPSLSLTEALRLAVERSQQLAANEAALSATGQMALAAGQLPDPVLKAGVQNVPLTGPDRFSLTRDFMTMRNIGVMQEFTRGEKRALRVERVEREADRLRAERQHVQAGVQRETALAWIERHYSEASAQLIRRQLDETQLQIQGAEIAYRTGRGNQADVFAGRAARASLGDRLRQVERQHQSAGLALARWAGPAAAQVRTDGSVPWQDAPAAVVLLETGLQEHPAVRIAAAQVATAQAEARLAEANRRPDVTVEAMYSRRGPAFSDMFSIGVSVPLPIYPGARQDRELAAKLASLQEARARYEDALLEQGAAVRVLVNEWQAGKERIAGLQQELLPAAANRTEGALIAYGTGKGDLLAVLAARRDELDARMQVLSLEMETARAWAQLKFLLPQDGSAAGASR